MKTGEMSWRPLIKSLVEKLDVYGRENDKASIIKILLNDKEDNNTFFVISIMGMGGIRKATSALLV